MKAVMIRKAYNLNNLRSEIAKTDNLQNISVEKTILLTDGEFEDFCGDLLQDKDWILENINIMDYDNLTKTWHCIAIICETGNEAILIESEGYRYARYSSIVLKKDIIQD